MEWMNGVITLLSIVAAILAWAAKLRWSKEYREAQDKIVEAKDAQIEVLREQIKGLREMTPAKLVEYRQLMQMELEAYNDRLLDQVSIAESVIGEKDGKLSEMQARESTDAAAIAQLVSEKEELEGAVQELRDQFSAMPTVAPLTLDMAALGQVYDASLGLSNLLDSMSSSHRSGPPWSAALPFKYSGDGIKWYGLSNSSSNGADKEGREDDSEA